MTEIYIVESTHSLNKPFTLTKRVADMAETNYYDICLLTFENAQLLAKSGVSWRAGPPDEIKLIQRLKILEATQNLKAAQEQLDELNEGKP